MEKFAVTRIQGIHYVLEWDGEKEVYVAIANCPTYDKAHNIAVALTEHERKVVYETAVATGVPVDKP